MPKFMTLRVALKGNSWPMVGAVVDRLTYLHTLRLWLLSLSFGVAGMSGTVVVLFNGLISSFPAAFVALAVTNVAGALAALSTLAGTILIERKWVVVITGGKAESDQPELQDAGAGAVRVHHQLRLHGGLRRVEPRCSVGPVPPLRLCLRLYAGFLSLSTATRLAATTDNKSPPLSLSLIILCWESWVVYGRQEVFLPGNGIPAYVISLAHGVSAVVGIAATWAYPVARSWLSTIRTGLWSVWAQWCCLLACVASVWDFGELIVLSLHLVTCAVVIYKLHVYGCGRTYSISTGSCPR
uniref:Solute carrier family 40 member n=1 Tax=Leersia perrieri TaxID=77586 RepID=A0A0D9WEA4_9ORYZ